jgi:UDP-N-acetyl-2-amino-2-deoxyglucuronate dehydrogenase
MAKRFALIGASGYVAPRHMEAIKEVGGELVAALDPHDSVGVLDSYFPECAFFTEFERFDRHCSRRGDIDYVSIASPNYLHDSHARFALRIGADAIVEKPVCLHPRNVEELMKVEDETGQKVWCISQLRYNNGIDAWEPQNDGPHAVTIIYYAPRGKWYDYSWKGNEEKSGGVIFNIGVHLVDACTYLYGPLQSIVWIHTSRRGRAIAGHLGLENANVSFTLSVDGHFPKRSMTVDNVNIDLTDGMSQGHIVSYQDIVGDGGFGLEDMQETIKICHEIRFFRKG